MQADWNIVKKGWYAHVLGEAPHTFTDALDAVKTLRVRQSELERKPQPVTPTFCMLNPFEGCTL